MSIAVEARSTFNFKPATFLFEGRYFRSTQPPSYDVAPDGRFLMMKAVDAQLAPPMTIVLNWTEALKARRPAN
jgi:hypothetical protein